jgi:hypothetical protein
VLVILAEQWSLGCRKGVCWYGVICCVSWMGCFHHWTTCQPCQQNQLSYTIKFKFMSNVSTVNNCLNSFILKSNDYLWRNELLLRNQTLLEPCCRVQDIIPHHGTAQYKPNRIIIDNITAMAAQLETNSIATTPPFAGMPSMHKGYATKKIQNNARFDEFSQLQGKHSLDA